MKIGDWVSLGPISYFYMQASEMRVWSDVML